LLGSLARKGLISVPFLPPPPSTAAVGPSGPTSARLLTGPSTSGYDLTVRANDREYATTWVLADNGTPLVIPPGSSVTFQVTVLGDSDMTAGGGPASVVDAANGKVSYIWRLGDIVGPGSYWAAFVVTFVDGGIRNYPNSRYLRILVTPVLGV
jgi:hypothetical protein